MLRGWRPIHGRGASGLVLVMDGDELGQDKIGQRRGATVTMPLSSFLTQSSFCSQCSWLHHHFHFKILGRIMFYNPKPHIKLINWYGMRKQKLWLKREKRRLFRLFTGNRLWFEKINQKEISLSHSQIPTALGHIPVSVSQEGQLLNHFYDFFSHKDAKSQREF